MTIDINKEAMVISKSKFKPRVLEFLRLVEKERGELIITDHGRPVAKVVPYDEAEPEEILRNLRGSVFDYEEPTKPVAVDDWESL